MCVASRVVLYGWWFICVAQRTTTHLPPPIIHPPTARRALSSLLFSSSPLACAPLYTKRLLDVLNRHLGGLDGNKKATPYLCGDSLTIADLCAWPWFGNIVLGRLYGGSDTFLQVGEYTFVKAWADRVHARKGVQRGRCVNRPWGGAHEKLPNRHSASDFDSLPAPPEQKGE